MAQKLIESLEFQEEQQEGGAYIYVIVESSLIINLVIIYKMYLLLLQPICAILRDMNAFWRRWRQDNWDVPIDIVYVGGPPSSNMGVRHLRIQNYSKRNQ